MSIQSIINQATGIAISKKPVVAQSFSRSQQLKTAQRGPRIWSFAVTMHNGLRYSENRGLLEELDRVDRLLESEISLSDSAGMAYIMRYQGNLNSTQLNALQISDWATGSTTFTLTTLPAVSSTTVLFRAGDYIQPTDSRYPYTVTGDVVRGEGTTVQVPVNRGRVNEVGYDPVGKTLHVGTDVTWRVVATQVPTYTLEAGDLVSWSGQFVLVEAIQ